MRRLPVLAVLLLLLFSACSGREKSPIVPADSGEVLPSVEQEAAAEAAAKAATEAAMRERAAYIAASLDDRQLAAQVIISGIDGKGQLSPDMRILLADCPVGGIMLFRYNLDTDNDAIHNLIEEASSLVIAGNDGTAIPPFAAVDHEGGSVNRFRRGVADLPPACSYGETALSEGRETVIAKINADSVNAGSTIKRLGINLNLAPVAEYLNDENRVFLEDRAYGHDPDFVIEAAKAFINGMEQAGVLCAVKHFPGSAGPDPHYFSSTLGGGREALAELARPFSALIDSGHARAIMVSHSLLPVLDSDNIASLSPAIMGGWLRQELGFCGIIICDDFSMASAGGKAATGSPASSETLAVRSLAAGADMVMVWPPDLRRTHRAILAALDNGGLPRYRLREAATRIIFAKMETGIIE